MLLMAICPQAARLNLVARPPARSVRVLYADVKLVIKVNEGDVALKDGEGTVRTGKSRSLYLWMFLGATWRLSLWMFPGATRRLAVAPTGAYRDEDLPFQYAHGHARSHR